MTKKFFFIFLLFIIHIQPLRAEQTGVIKTEDVIVIFDKPLALAAKEVADLCPELNSDLEKILRWKLDFRPTVILVRENEKFQRMTGSDLIVAFANPQKRLIVIDYSKMNLHPFSLEITLKHEICHLLLHNHIRRENLPKWLDEGVAQWASDGISELIMGKKQSMLNRAALSGNIIDMDALTYRFPRNKNALILAYEESKSIVEYMRREFGENGILTLLRHLKDGDKADTAILKSFSVSSDELEKRWLENLRKRTTWFTYFSVHIYDILFFLGAVMTVYGFIRLRLRKRKYEDEDEDEDYED